MLVLISSDGLASEYRDKGYLYLSPEPRAEYAPPETRFVLVRFEHIAPNAVTNLPGFIQVTGASSGDHSGQTRIASDGRTVIFEMSAGFQTNEVVTVALNPLLEIGTAGSVEPYEYQFAIGGPMPDAAPVAVSPLPNAVRVSPQADGSGPDDGPPPGPQKYGVARIMPNGVSVPSDFPEVVVSTNRDPSPGYIFLSNPGQTGLRYTLMLDNDGSPVWYVRGGGANFRVQDNGMITWVASVVYDQNFKYIKSYHTVNGYIANWHEFRLLADDTCLMLGDHLETVDMTRYLADANPQAEVRERVIQEFTAAGDLVFQWRGWDHYDVRDLRLNDPLGASFSFPHMNALAVDEDKHLLVSSRNVNEVTKINRDTGEVMWRLGGAHSDFTFVNDPWNGFSGQHYISALGNSHYMVFDNGNLHNPPASRAVEYELNLANMTATMTWQFRDTPDRFTDVMGSAQRLPNGHTLIDFVQGNFPRIVEVDKDGIKHLAMNLTPHEQIYRAQKYPWAGVVAVPYLIVEAYSDNITLLFNKFGDTNVAHYCIYGGTSPNLATLLATSPTTLWRLTDLENGRRHYFRVTAVDAQGKESGYSNEENVLVNLTRPGQNMVLNGDFSQGTAFWIWATNGTASATWSIAGGASYVHLVSPGSALTAIQLRQDGLKLEAGRQYVLEFDSWSSTRRVMEARLSQNQSPFATYKIASFSLTTSPQHFSVPFTAQTTDLNVLLAFNMGAASGDVYLDNVSLWMAAPGDFNQDRSVDLNDLSIFAAQWLRQGALKPDLNGDGKVDFTDFGILGKNWSSR